MVGAPQSSLNGGGVKSRLTMDSDDPVIVSGPNTKRKFMTNLPGLKSYASFEQYGQLDIQF